MDSERSNVNESVIVHVAVVLDELLDDKLLASVSEQLIVWRDCVGEILADAATVRDTDRVVVGDTVTVTVLRVKENVSVHVSVRERTFPVGVAVSVDVIVATVDGECVTVAMVPDVDWLCAPVTVADPVFRIVSLADAEHVRSTDCVGDRG